MSDLLQDELDIDGKKYNRVRNPDGTAKTENGQAVCARESGNFCI